jgi:hypothetical protein
MFFDTGGICDNFGCYRMDSFSHHSDLYMYRTADSGPQELREQIHGRTLFFYDGRVVLHFFDLDNVWAGKVSERLVYYYLQYPRRGLGFYYFMSVLDLPF